MKRSRIERQTPTTRHRRLAWVLLVLLPWSLLFATWPAAAQQDAAVDAAAADAEADADASDASDPILEEALTSKRAELTSLLAFRAGTLAEIRSTELFNLDLRDDEAVRRRLVEVRRDLDVARASAEGAHVPAVDASAPDAQVDAGPRDPRDSNTRLLEAPASHEILRLLIVRALEVRVEVMSLPAGERARLLVAEQDAIRSETARKERERTAQEAALAESARLKALQTAQEARTNAERQLAEVRARVEATRGEQLRARADLAELLGDADVADAAQKETLARARHDIEEIHAGSREADALYDRLVASLVKLRARASSLLQTLEGDMRAPRPKGSVALPDVSEAALVEERDRLAESLRVLEMEATALETEKKELTWTALGAVMEVERELNTLRIALLDQVSQEKRARVLGLGAEGRAQGLGELDRVKVELRWLRARGRELAHDAWRDLGSPAAIAHASFDLVALVVLLWATIVVRRRRSGWLRRVRNAAARSVRRPGLLRALQRGTAALDAIAGELVTLGAVLLIPSIPGIDVGTRGWSVPYTLLLWYWIYRLALAVTHRSLAWVASRKRTIDGLLRERILRSVRLVGRSAFFFAVLLSSSAAVVGQGYLHALVVRAAWLIAFLIAAVLVRQWRNDIADAYLRVRPTGTLSNLVSRTRTHWAGFFVVIAAFGVLLAGTLIRALRRFFLGFEQSRKALAFFFRRRLERQVTHSASSDALLLDPRTLAFFTEQPIEDGKLAIDRYPGLEAFEERFARFRRGEQVGATLIVGRTGFGKTSWLTAAEDRCDGVPVRRLSLERRATTAAGVLADIAAAAGIEASNHVDVDAVVERLNAGGPQVVSIDDAQLWFLRGIDTLEGWRTFTTIIERTSGSVLWLVAFAHYAWELLDWIGKGNHVFRAVVHLAPWSEAEIGDLLERRNAISGLEIVYDDLLVDDVRDGNDAARILTTARDYNRLVWDYAEGSPRVALHVWGRSLVPDGPGRARVRLFRNPNEDVLEKLSEPARFVLASTVWHERLSLEEVSLTLGLTRDTCADAFARLTENDVAEIEGGYLRVTPRWWPVVIRYLRRKHLIET